MADFFHAAWLVLLDLAPWLLLGALVAGVLHVLLPAGFLKRQFTGALGVVKAVVFGVPLPLCSCAVIPVGLSLKQGGAGNGATVAFLISTPQTGVDSVLVSASFLGWPFALFKVASAAVTGLFGGWWTDRERQFSLPIVATHATVSNHTVRPGRTLIDHSVELLRSIWRWLVFGVIVSAAITAYVPSDALSDLSAEHSFAAMVVTLLIALPLYVCATASIPIAAALVASGLPAGAALVFLMAGPATNVATIGAVFRALGRRALAIYLTTVIVGSISCGWFFDFLIDARVARIVHTHGSADWWSAASAVILLVLIAWFAVQEFLEWTHRWPTEPPTTEDATHDCCNAPN